MTHFRGTIQGNRGGTSRLGSKNSGLTATADEWDIGATVKARYNETLKCDEIVVTIDSGSGYGNDRIEKVYRKVDGKIMEIEK